MNVLRQLTCIVLSLFLFVACNQSRHIVSDKAKAADQAYLKAHIEEIETLCTSAKKLVGKPYRLGSSGPKSYDCSGFTAAVFQSIHLSLPRMAFDQAQVGHTIKLPLIKPGDLLFFGNKKIDHVAMISKVKSGKTYFIHSTSCKGVVEQVLEDSDYWMKRLKLARRVII